MKHIIGYFLAITLLPVSIVAWKSDWVQQRVNPEIYWNDRISQLEATVKFYQNDVYSCWLELKKLRENKNIEFQQHMLDGLTPDAAVELYTSDLQLTIEVCSFYQEALEEAEKELRVAKKMFSKAIRE